MSTVKLHCLIFGIFLQILISSTNAKPVCPGEFDCYDSPCNYNCGPPPAIVPIPQPIPVRVPQPERHHQSVTIPNIILALLPPNNKPLVPRPRPVIRPPPVILPTPILPPISPLPSFSNYGGFGNSFGGSGGFGGCGGGYEGGCGGGCGGGCL